MDYYFKFEDDSRDQEYNDMAKGLNGACMLGMVVLIIALLLPEFF